VPANCIYQTPSTSPLPPVKVKDRGDKKSFRCSFCGKDRFAGKILYLSGVQYDRRRHVPLPNTGPQEETLELDNHCAEQAELYQQLCHYPHNLLLTIREEVRASAQRGCRSFCSALRARVPDNI
jgi:hypothetical protein